jgi:ATP-binding protein involved in chromosome partitioning
MSTQCADKATVNLALAFARRGIRTGILDTDIFGPSIPTLLNLSGEPRLDDSKHRMPFSALPQAPNQTGH